MVTDLYSSKYNRIDRAIFGHLSRGFTAQIIFGQLSWATTFYDIFGQLSRESAAKSLFGKLSLEQLKQYSDNFLGNYTKTKVRQQSKDPIAKNMHVYGQLSRETTAKTIFR